MNIIDEINKRRDAKNLETIKRNERKRIEEFYKAIKETNKENLPSEIFKKKKEEINKKYSKYLNDVSFIKENLKRNSWEILDFLRDKQREAVIIEYSTEVSDFNRKARKNHDIDIFVNYEKAVKHFPPEILTEEFIVNNSEIYPNLISLLDPNIPKNKKIIENTIIHNPNKIDKMMGYIPKAYLSDENFILNITSKNPGLIFLSTNMTESLATKLIEQDINNYTYIAKFHGNTPSVLTNSEMLLKYLEHNNYNLTYEQLEAIKKPLEYALTHDKEFCIKMLENNQYQFYDMMHPNIQNDLKNIVIENLDIAMKKNNQISEKLENDIDFCLEILQKGNYQYYYDMGIDIQKNNSIIEHILDNFPEAIKQNKYIAEDRRFIFAYIEHNLDKMHINETREQIISPIKKQLDNLLQNDKNFCNKMLELGIVEFYPKMGKQIQQSSKIIDNTLIILSKRTSNKDFDINRLEDNLNIDKNTTEVITNTKIIKSISQLIDNLSESGCLNQISQNPNELQKNCNEL